MSNVEHISIFEKVKNYKSDPITEFYKILNFLHDQKCTNHLSAQDILDEYYYLCAPLSNVYPTYDECVLSNTKNISRYRNGDYYLLNNEDRDIVLDDFLTYCEIILHCFYVLDDDGSLREYYDFDNQSFLRIEAIVKTSLSSLGYCYKVNKEDLFIKISKISPVAESVALFSPPKLKEAIELYLTIRNEDTKNKRLTVHYIIDLLEPTLKKYENQPLVKKVKEYSQLLRHPEINKEKDEYKWFYKNEKKYLDDLFNLCIFVQQYALANDTIKIFDDNKKGNE